MKAQRAFRLAELTDDKDRWIGGEAVCVQVGHGDIAVKQAVDVGFALVFLQSPVFSAASTTQRGCGYCMMERDVTQ
jgi:hypothetical protein